MNPKHPDAIDEKPFVGMLIDDTSILDKIEGRSACSKCFKSRKYFCYSCCVPIPELEGRIPSVELPIQIDIIKHRQEINGKSTAFHGAILAPEHVKIYTYPDIPDYLNESGVYLVYPSSKAKYINDMLINQGDSNDCDDERSLHNGTLLTKRINYNGSFRRVNLEELPIKKAVFIDSTWNQSRGIYKDERVRSLPCVVIQNRASQFWRHQKGSPRWYLATIEAMHQFLLELHLNMWGVSKHYEGPYCENYERVDCGDLKVKPYYGQYDNILFFFSFMYGKIHSLYEHDKLEAYKRPF